MAKLTGKSLTGLWMVLASAVIIVGIGATVLFAVDWLSAGRIEQRAEELAKQQMAAMAQQPQGPPPAAVRVAEVKQQTLQQRVSVVGRLREVRRATVASEVEGRVLEVLVDVGDRLTGPTENEPGTLIARIDGVWADLAVEQARADLSESEARRRQADRELARLETLKARGAADPQALDDALATAEAEAARVQAMTAALHRAEQIAHRSEVRAPFDASVTAKHTEAGQWLDPGTNVVEIVSRGQIDAVIDVPEQFISSLRIGTEIDVVIEPLGRTATGRVAAINPVGANAARTYPVKVRLQDEDGRLKVGMSVIARVPLDAQATYLTVPRDAMAFSENGPQVWLSLMLPGAGGPPGGEGGPPPMPQAMSLDVQVLFGEGDRFAIRPLPKTPGMGLAPGMAVVIEGKESLWPTRPLIVVPPGPPLEKPGPPPGPDANPQDPADPTDPPDSAAEVAADPTANAD
ncbi:MAG: efflux RND transporter periplasmic adaptor subunit [Planctomycetota bacterium]